MAKKKTYESSFQRLEEILDKLENQQLGLEESLSLFQEGIEHYKSCREQLNQVEEALTVVLAESGIESMKPLQEEMEDD